MADEGGVKRNPGSWSLSSKSTTTSPRPRGTRAHSSRARTRIAHSISTTWPMFPSSSLGCREIQLASSQSASMASPQAHFRKKQEKGGDCPAPFGFNAAGCRILGVSTALFDLQSPVLVLSALQQLPKSPCQAFVGVVGPMLWLFGQRSKYQPSNELQPNQFSRGISRLISLALFGDAAAVGNRRGTAKRGNISFTKPQHC
jgi:hypothetical protein